MNEISIYEFWKAGGLDVPIRLGVVRSAVIEYCQIYEIYITYRQQGANYASAVEMTAEKMCLTEGKVKSAIAAVV